jgi:hypothetical protein
LPDQGSGVLDHRFQLCSDAPFRLQGLIELVETDPKELPLAGQLLDEIELIFRVLGKGFS